jgi:hypothetical protein
MEIGCYAVGIGVAADSVVIKQIAVSTEACGDCSLWALDAREPMDTMAVRPHSAASMGSAVRGGQQRDQARRRSK